jgi:hypothetical protein
MILHCLFLSTTGVGFWGFSTALISFLGKDEVTDFHTFTIYYM